MAFGILGIIYDDAKTQAIICTVIAAGLIIFVYLKNTGFSICK